MSTEQNAAPVIRSEDLSGAIKASNHDVFSTMLRVELKPGKVFTERQVSNSVRPGFPVPRMLNV